MEIIHDEFGGTYLDGKYVSKEEKQAVLDWMPTEMSEETRKAIFGDLLEEEKE